MLRKLIVAFFVLCGAAFAQGTLAGANGDCTIGGQQTLTSGLPSTATQQIGTTNILAGAGVQASFPACLVTVYATGSSNKASIYADNLVTPTPLGNPFTANVDGSWTFYVPTGACYDITLSTYQGPPLPYLRTYSDVCFGSGSGSGTITGVTPGGFLLLTGSTVGFQGCSVSGQVPTWNGATWGCGTPGSGSVVSVTGTANEIVVTNPTTTPQIFLANPGITPGDWTVGGNGYFNNNATVTLLLTANGGLLANTITDSALTSGQCVQASTGGLLATTGSPCGNSGGGITGSGTNGNLTEFTGTSSVGNAPIVDTGTVLNSSERIQITTSTSNPLAFLTSSAATGTACNGSNSFVANPGPDCNAVSITVNPATGSTGVAAAIYGNLQSPNGAFTSTPSLAGVFGNTVTGNSGTSPLFVSGVVGVGDLYGSTSATNVTGVTGIAEYSGSGTPSLLLGIDGQVQNVTGSNTAAFGAALYARSPVISSGGVVTDIYGLYIADQTTGGGTVNPNPFGIYEAGTAKNVFNGSLTVAGLSGCLNATAGLIGSTGSACGSGGGSSALSSITAATTTNTIANGNNGGQVWNWTLTSASLAAFTFGETTAATGSGDQLLVVKTLSGSSAVPLTVSNTLSGSQAFPAVQITPTWNTTGVVDAALLINPTNAASGAGSLLIDSQLGGTSQWSLTKAGVTTQTGNLNLIADGVHAGSAQLIGNTTAPTLTANTFSLIGPNVASFTAWGIQMSSNSPSAPSILKLATVSGGISVASLLGIQGTDSNVLTSGTVSGSAGTLLCLDGNAGATTTGCSSGGSLPSALLGQGVANSNGSTSYLAQNDPTYCQVFSGSTLDVILNGCVAQVITLGGGTADARGLDNAFSGSKTIASQVNAGELLGPTLTVASGGSLTSGNVYKVVYTLNSPSCSPCSASQENSITPSGGNLSFTVTSPTYYGTATTYDVWVTAGNGASWTETKCTSSPTTIGTTTTISSVGSCTGTVSQQNVGVTLLVPAAGTWTCTATTGYCLEFFDQNNTIGTNSFGGHGLSINLASTGSVTSVCATDPNPKQGGQSVHVKGIKCNSTAAGATVTNAAFEWQKTFDGAGAAEIEAQNNTTYALWLHGSGYFYNMHGSSYPQSGSTGTACVVGGSSGTGSGLIIISELYCPGTGTGNANLNFTGGNTSLWLYGLYMERGDTSCGPWVDLGTGANQLGTVHILGYNQASNTCTNNPYFVKIESHMTQVELTDPTSGTLTNCIDDLKNTTSGPSANGTYTCAQLGNARYEFANNSANFNAGINTTSLAATALATFSSAGAASTPGVLITGAPYAGGTATTNFPQLYLNDGTGPTTFSTAGTEFGINTPSGFTGNLLDGHVNGGTSVFSINYQGNELLSGTFGVTGHVTLEGVTSTGATGTANLVFATSPTLITPALGAATATSLLASGIVDGTAPVATGTGTTFTFGGGTYKSGYYANQEATAGTGVTGTLPATATGLQYCVYNDIVSGTGAPDTGVLTVYPPSGSYVVLNGVINTIGGGGTHGVASGGAAADSACFLATDSTHWKVWVIKGTWTAN